MCLETKIDARTEHTSGIYPQQAAVRIMRFGLGLVFLACMLGQSTAQVTRDALQGSTPPALSPGAPAGSYPLSGFDNVNLYNGNLNFSLPLYTVGGRGEARYSITLPIERHWRVESHLAPLPGLPGNCDQACDPAGESTSGVHLYVPHSDWWGFEGGGSDAANPNSQPPPHSPGLLVARSQGHPNSGCTGVKFLNGRTIRVSYRDTTTVLTFIAPDGTEYEFRDQLTGGRPLSTNFTGSPCNPTNTDRGTVFVTTDGTSATFVSNIDIQDDPGTPLGVTYPSGTLYLSSGVVYQISNGTVQTITDRNGNKIQFIYGPDPVTHLLIRVTQVIDPLGRTIDITYGDSSNPPVANDTITYPGFGGATRSIKIWHVNLVDALRATQAGDITNVLPKSSSSLFSEIYAINDANQQAAQACCGQSAPFPDERNDVVNPVVIQAVELPDGRRYQFRYNQYGELARVDLPTGGAYEYDWGSGVPGSAEGVKQNSTNPLQYEIYRRVLRKRVYSDGVTNVLDKADTFSAQESFDNTLGRQVTSVTTDSNSSGGGLLARSIHYFLGNTSASLFLGGAQAAFDEGKEFKTEAYALDGTTLLRSVVNNWQEAPAACPITNSLPDLNNLPFALAFATKVAYNPRNLGTATTLETGQTSKVAYQYDCFNNVTETDDFDYGASSPTRVTVNAYLTSQGVGGVSVDYTAPPLHLRRLMTGATVQGPVGGSLTTVATTSYNYDEITSPISDEPGIVGHGVKFPTTYRTRGNQTSITRYTNASSQSGPITSRSAYDIAGNVVSATDPNGNVTSYTYDATGGTFAFVSSVTLPAPGLHGSSSTLTVHKTNDFNTGLLTSFSDFNGQVTNYDYTDPLDRPVGVTHPDGGSTTVIYGDTTGDLNVHIVTALDSARNMESYTYFDGVGRKIRALQFDGTNGTPWIATDTAYDALGRVVTVTNPHRISQPSVTPDGCSAVAPCTTTAYDALGRVISVITPDGQAVTTGYTGNSTRTTDQAGNTRDEVKDALDRLVQVTENPTNVNGDGSPVTTYAYDAQNNLLCVHQKGADSTPDKACSDTTVPPTWRPRNFTFDSLSRLLTASNPESGTTQYGYDNNGNQTTKTDANGTVITTTYDALNRPSLVTYSDSTPTLTHFYDGTGSNSLGRLSFVSSADPSSGNYSFDNYDPVGRVLGTTQTVDGQPYTMFYVYDLAGHQISESYPSGRIVQTGYDVAGRISSINAKVNPQPYADQIQYSAHGGVTDLVLGNGVWEHTVYDSNRLQTTEIDIGSSKGAQDLLSLRYDYGSATQNNNGNVRRHMITAPGLALTQLIQYDGLNRLSKMQELTGANIPFPLQPAPAWEQDFTQDFWGNRTSLVSTGFVPVVPTVAPDTNNRISVAQDSRYSYDAAGYLKTEPVGSGINTYSYDAEGQLTKAQEAGATQIFTYNGQGNRVKKIAGAVTTVYVRDVNGDLVAEYSDTTTQNNGTRYLTQDILGSERLVTGADSSGNPSVVARYDYLPFGELIPTGLSSRFAVTGYGNIGASQQKFAGKQRETESGLDYFGARYYSSSTGRFISADWSEEPVPVPYAHFDEPQTLNLYVYPGNPTTYVDVDGHSHKHPKNHPKPSVAYAREGRRQAVKQAIAQRKLPIPPPETDDIRRPIPGDWLASAVTAWDYGVAWVNFIQLNLRDGDKKQNLSMGVPVDEHANPIAPGKKVYFEPTLDSQKKFWDAAGEPAPIWTGYGYWHGVEISDYIGNGHPVPVLSLPPVGNPAFWKSTNDEGCSADYLNKVHQDLPDFYKKAIAPMIPKP